MPITLLEMRGIPGHRREHVDDVRIDDDSTVIAERVRETVTGGGLPTRS
jgi:hypothetical protein